MRSRARQAWKRRLGEPKLARNTIGQGDGHTGRMSRLTTRRPNEFDARGTRGNVSLLLLEARVRGSLKELPELATAVSAILSGYTYP